MENRIKSVTIQMPNEDPETYRVGDYEITEIDMETKPNGNKIYAIYKNNKLYVEYKEDLALKVEYFIN